MEGDGQMRGFLSPCGLGVSGGGIAMQGKAGVRAQIYVDISEVKKGESSGEECLLGIGVYFLGVVKEVLFVDFRFVKEDGDGEKFSKVDELLEWKGGVKGS